MGEVDCICYTVGCMGGLIDMGPVHPAHGESQFPRDFMFSTTHVLFDLHDGEWRKGMDYYSDTNTSTNRFYPTKVGGGLDFSNIKGE